MRHLLTLLLILPLLLLIGCAKKVETRYAYADEPAASGYIDDTGAYYESDADSMGEMSRPTALATLAPEPEPEPQPEPAVEARKVHYNGYASLLATQPEETVAQVVTLAEDSGGYVERRTLTEATVRVPVDRFSETWDAALALGEVLDKSLTAEDITDAYLAVALRLKTARATRARLQELLAQASDEVEKLSLLREIQRLTEAIDVQESRVRTLAQLASFSRLTVQVSPRQAYAQGGSAARPPEISGFEWIHQLSPFRRDVAHSGRRLKLSVPEGLVALDTERRFVAESADGAVVWSCRLPNEPRGDTDYWLAALRERLEPEFEGAEVQPIGDFSALRLLEPGAADPYRYLLAVRAEGRWLELVEIYYPGQTQEDRYAAAVRATLSEIGGAS